MSRLGPNQAYDLQGRILNNVVPPPPFPGVMNLPRSEPCPGREGPRSGFSHKRCHPPPRHWDVSTVEIATFFPDWYQIPQVALRLLVNGWSALTMVGMEVGTRDYRDRVSRGNFELSLDVWNRGAFNAFWQTPLIQEAKREIGDGVLDRNYWRRRGVGDDLTPATWGPSRLWEPGYRDFQHWKLVQIWKEIHPRSWPRASDRLLTTQCLEFAAKNPHLDLDTSHYQWIANLLRLEAPRRQRARDDLMACDGIYHVVQTLVSGSHLDNIDRSRADPGLRQMAGVWPYTQQI